MIPPVNMFHSNGRVDLELFIGISQFPCSFAQILKEWYQLVPKIHFSAVNHGRSSGIRLVILLPPMKVQSLFSMLIYL